MSIIGKTTANKAFTLIEIMIVVVILGIILALSAPNFSKQYAYFQINKTADDLLNISRWAQAMAIGQQRTYALTFSYDHQSYGLERVRDVDGLDGQPGFERVPGSLGRMHPVPDSIHITCKGSSDSQGNMDLERIDFYPDGTIDGATIQLNSSQHKEVLSTAAVRGMLTRVNDG